MKQTTAPAASYAELASARKRFLAKTPAQAPDQCWIWSGAVSTEGYGTWRFSVGPNDRRTVLVHRAMFMITNGPLSNQEIVRHTCHVRSCYNPSHLRSGSHEDNVMDRVMAQRSAQGVENGRAKLHDELVATIKYRILKGEGCYSLAKEYGVDPATIRHIRNGKSWKHIEPKPEDL